MFSASFRGNWICLNRSDSMNVNEDLTTISYRLLCDTAMNMEIIEPPLVILVGTCCYS